METRATEQTTRWRKVRKGAAKIAKPPMRAQRGRIAIECLMALRANKDVIAPLRTIASLAVKDSFNLRASVV